MADPSHWNERYETVGVRSVSWYEDRPAMSLELLDALGVTPAQSVIDVGGGASALVDHLLDAGHADVAVLDISIAALEAARQRLMRARTVTWIEADLLRWTPTRTWDVWHDRAVLHFLVDDDDRRIYVDTMRRALSTGGSFVIGVFAEDGPTQCSGLPVRRYTQEDLAELLGDVDIVERRRHVHHTPSGAEQPFNWIGGRLRT